MNIFLNREHLMDHDSYGGYLNTNDSILGAQKYMWLSPGYDGKVDSSQPFEDGVVLLISTWAVNDVNPKRIRLNLHGQSLASISADQIYIPMTVNGTISIPSLRDLQDDYVETNNISRNVQPVPLNPRNSYVNEVRNALNPLDAIANAVNRNGNVGGQLRSVCKNCTTGRYHM